MPKNFGIYPSMEILNYHQRILHEQGLNIFDYLNNLIFFFIVIEKVFLKFPYHFNPIGKEIYDYISKIDSNLCKIF